MQITDSQVEVTNGGRLFRIPLQRALLAMVCGVCLSGISAASAFADSPLSWAAPVSVNGSAAIQGLSCPTASLCVGVSGQTVVTSTNPTGGAPAWTATSVDGTTALTSVSCTTTPTTLCVAGDFSGNLLTATNPTGNMAADWTAAAADSGHLLKGVSCQSASLCVAGDSGGNVVTATNPTGGAAAWTVTHLETQGL
jgi:hypothetical protein